MRVLRQAASAGVADYVDVLALQKASAVRAAANDVEDEEEGSMNIPGIKIDMTPEEQHEADVAELTNYRKVGE
jgi:hypothetical protein